MPVFNAINPPTYTEPATVTLSADTPNVTWSATGPGLSYPEITFTDNGDGTATIQAQPTSSLPINIDTTLDVTATNTITNASTTETIPVKIIPGPIIYPSIDSRYGYLIYPPLCDKLVDDYDITTQYGPFPDSSYRGRTEVLYCRATYDFYEYTISAVSENPSAQLVWDIANITWTNGSNSLSPQDFVLTDLGNGQLHIAFKHGILSPGTQYAYYQARIEVRDEFFTQLPNYPTDYIDLYMIAEGPPGFGGA